MAEFETGDAQKIIDERRAAISASRQEIQPSSTVPTPALQNQEIPNPLPEVNLPTPPAPDAQPPTNPQPTEQPHLSSQTASEQITPTPIQTASETTPQITPQQSPSSEEPRTSN